MTVIVRLLVHARAPSTRQDDDQHVAQAAAYLDLDHTLSSRVHTIWPPVRVSSEGLTDHTSPPERMIDGPDPTTFIDDTQLAYTSLESQLLPSSARPVRSTPARRKLCEPYATSTAPAPTRKSTRYSKGPTTRPQVLEQNERSWSNCDPSDSESRSERASVERQVFQLKPKEDTEIIQCTSTTNDTTSVLPESYSLGDIVERPQLSEVPLNDPGPSTPMGGSSQEAVTPLHRQQNNLHEEQRLASTKNVPPNLQKSIECDKGTKTASATSLAANGALPTSDSDNQNLSTWIRPPEPEASLSSFITHVTPTLNGLAQNPELTATFMPIVSHRNLDIHERGYWEVQCPTWPLELQISFWQTLETVVGTGKAGWGVWCSRGTEASLCSQSSQQRAGPTDQGSGPELQFGPVRVFCWGEIVKHIYLLLFVASNSKVRKLGLQWIDAQGTVVIQMRTG